MKRKQTITIADRKRIKLLILDIDGVMTDGKIGYDSQGHDYRFFHVHDGYGIQLAKKMGIKIVIISGKVSSLISRRAKDLGITEVFLGIKHKETLLDQLLHKHKLKKNQVAAIGDDLLDLALLKMVGLPITVANARPEVKQIARFITELSGGDGAVREAIDFILKAKR